jgi:hypothetical protein
MSESDKNFIEKLTEIKNRILKSEVVRIGFPVFAGILLIFFLLPFFFNNSALKFQISQKASKILGADFTVFGDAEVAFLPSPTITLNEVLLREYRVNTNKDRDNKIHNFYAKKVQIKLALFNFSQGLAIKKIIFSDAVLQSYYESNKAAIRSDKFSEISGNIAENPPKNEAKSTSGVTTKLFSIGDVNSNLSLEKLPIIVIKNGRGFFYDSFDKKNETSSLSAEFKFGSKKISSSGSFISGGVVSNFKAQARFNSNSKKPDSFFELVSPSTEIRIVGNFSSENLGISKSTFSGKIEGEILEFKSFYKSYISNNGSFADKLKLNSKPIKISANISSKDGLIEIDDLLVNSSLINGEGSIDLDLSGQIPAIDMNLDLANLDLNNFLSDEILAISYGENTLDDKFKFAGNEVAESLQKISSDVKDAQKSQIISEEKTPKLELVTNLRNFDLSAEIKIANIALFAGEIKDASLYLTISKEGEILVAPALFTIPGDGAFRAWGVLDNSGSLPKFIGKFDLSGKSLEDVFRWLKIESQSLKFGNLKQYKIRSDIFLTPNLSKFGNFYLSLNTDSSELLGELTIDNSDKITGIKSRFRGNRFDVDDYFYTSNSSTYFSPGLLIKKLLWLNNISSSADLDLSFDKMIYNKEEFTNQKMRLKFGRGYVQIDNLELQSAQTDLKADMLIDISEKSPQFTLNVAANNFHYEDDFEAGEEYFSNSSKPDLIDRFFDLPSLDSFNGNVNLTFANFNLNQRPIKNLKFQSRLISGSLKNSTLSCEAYGGTLDYAGLIGLGLSKTFSGNLTIKQAMLQDLLSDFLAVKNVSGIANISASISSSASKKGAFKENLNSEIKFNVNTPSIKGYGLDNLVKKMFAPKLNAVELQEPEKIILDSQAVTLFKKASGSVKINNGVGKVSANISGLAVNAVVSGSVDLPKNNINVLFNAIFLTGTRNKPVPINIASNVGGNFNALNQSLNIDQVRQYFGLAKLPVSTQVNSSELPMPNDLKSQILQPSFDQ